MDTSFTDIALITSAGDSSTRWVSVHQPDLIPGRRGQQVKEDELNVVDHVVSHVQLSRALVPGVAMISVQGLRASLPPTQHYLRFSSLKTLPIQVRISGGSFSTSLAWSALPGSIISVPPGLHNFDVQVTLSDLFLGLPAEASYRPRRHILHWTVFEEQANPDEESCATSCRHNPDCLVHFVGHGGCFFIVNDHEQQELDQSRGIRYSLEHDASVHRTLSGKLTGCNLNTTSSQCAMVEVRDQVLQLGHIRPDWQGTSARLILSLIMEVGEQRFYSDVGAIAMKRGLPLPHDALVQLSDAQSKEVIPTTVIIEDSGSLSIKVSEFDPLKTTALRLAVMPMLPDRAFTVEWSLPLPDANASEIESMRQHGRCAESNLVHNRYSICGGVGRIKDMPVSVPVVPWTGEVEELLRFTVAVRDRSGPILWPTTGVHEISVSFDGVDSPAAWGVQQHGCSLLESDLLVKHAILVSADATCRLLEMGCVASLCSLIDKEGLGGEQVWSINKMVPSAPMLSASSTVRVMGCLHSLGVCDITNAWEYHKGKLQLAQHGARVPLSTLLSEVEELQETGIELLTHVHAGFMSATADSHTVTDLHEALSEALWELPSPSIPLVATLAGLAENMPMLLLKALIRSSNKAFAQLIPRSLRDLEALHSPFSHVDTLEVNLQDAAQLEQVAIAMNLASKVRHLTVSCAECLPLARTPLLHDMLVLGLHFRGLDVLRIEHLVLTAPELGPPLETALTASYGLQELKFHSVALASNAKYVAPAVSKMTGLVEVEVSQDTPEAASMVLHTLAENLPKNLTTILFHENNLGPHYGQILPDLIRRLPTLKVIFLQSNELGDAIGKGLVSSIATLKHIYRMIVKGNNFSKDTEEKIVDACNCCEFMSERSTGWETVCQRNIA